VKADIFINGYIGEGFEMFGDANFYNLNKLNEDIANLSSDITELDVHINSGGGLVSEGFAIHDKLVSLPYVVNTIVEGLCGSIATVIAQAGKKGKRSMFQNSEYFVHNPLWVPNAPDAHRAEDLEKLTADLRKYEAKILDFYVKATGASREDLQAKMSAETTLSAVEAKDLGFIDEVINTDVVAMVKYQIAAYVLPEKTKTTDTMSETKELKAEIKTGFDKIAQMFNTLLKGKVIAAALKLKDETTVYTDADSVDVGVKVYVDETMATPAPDGSHTLEDGTVIETVNGEVTTVTKPAEDETSAVKAENEQLKAQLAEAQGQIAAANEEKEQFIAAAKAAKDEFVAFQNKIITGGGEIFDTANTDPKAGKPKIIDATKNPIAAAHALRKEKEAAAEAAKNAKK
jgi:ATP-dependent Clp endopeptidase proteolytic subunit ClpP